MVTQRDTRRRAQPQGKKEQELRMRPAKRQLLNENSLPIPPIPPTVVPPPAVPSQRSQPTSKNDLPYPPHVPPLNAEGNPMGHLVPNVAAAEPSMLRDRYNSNNPYVAEATRLAKKYGLPENIFLALIHQESRFDANALSPAGAIGLTQLMPGTASDMDVDPRDPMQNLEGGARYLAQQYKAFGEWPLALAAYNAGPSRVRKAGNVIPNNKETQNYVPTVLRNAGVAGYADGGLVDLSRKYADGGPVANASHVYDPDVIAAIAASVVDPRGYAEGGGVDGDEVTLDPAASLEDLGQRYGMGAVDQMALARPSTGGGLSDALSQRESSHTPWQSPFDYLRPVGQGLLEIPGSIRNYAIDVAADQSPFARLGSDIGNLGSAVWKGIKEDPVGAILDVLPGVGEIRSGMDAHDMRNKAEAAERAGDEGQAAVYRQLSAMGMVGAIPFFGMASRAANRGVRAGAEAAARVGLDAAAVVPRELSPLGFYSHGAETAANLAQAKGTPDQMAAMLRKYGVKPDEFYNTGIADEAATNVMRSKIERDYAPKLAAAKLEMDALGLNENTINKKSPDYNRALEIRDSPETKAKYRYDIALNAMRSEMDSAMVLRPEWASRPSVTREDLAKHFSERRPQIEETVLGKTTKSQPYPEEYTKIEQDIQSRYLGEIERLRSVYFDNAEDWSVRTEAAKKAQDLYDEMVLKINEAIPNREALIQAARDTTTPTKFQQYTLPGGENYREVLLKLSDPSNTQPQIDAISKRMDEIQDRPQNQITPELKEEWHGLITELDNITKKTNLFESTHWDDPNVLAHQIGRAHV